MIQLAIDEAFSYRSEGRLELNPKFGLANNALLNIPTPFNHFRHGQRSVFLAQSDWLSVLNLTR